MKEYIALFFTHSGAIKFHRFTKKNNIDCELMPVPRKLSSNCGVCAKFYYDQSLTSVISKDIEKIFESNGENYILVYEEE